MMPSALENVGIGLRTSLDTFLALPANATVAIASENMKYDPVLETTYVEPTLFIDPSERAALGTNGLRRHFGRFHINIHGEMNVGPTPLEVVAARLLAFFDPFTTPTITQGSTVIRIGNGLPYTVESATNGNWRTKPVIIPWWCEEVPS